MRPYFEEDGVVIYHADCRDVLPLTEPIAVLVTDPPYGIAYKSGMDGVLKRAIVGDADTSLRDWVLDWWGPCPALVFGSWRAPRPKDTRMVLIWDKGGALGMGDLSLPWKPGHEEIYVIGDGFSGRRSSDVIAVPPVQSMAKNGRLHPLEKPVGLLTQLIAKCPAGTVLDPFMGSGTTLVAAKRFGRRAIGIEINEGYAEIAAQRLSQQVLALR